MFLWVLYQRASLSMGLQSSTQNQAHTECELIQLILIHYCYFSSVLLFMCCEAAEDEPQSFAELVPFSQSHSLSLSLFPPLQPPDGRWTWLPWTLLTESVRMGVNGAVGEVGGRILKDGQRKKGDVWRIASRKRAQNLKQQQLWQSANHATFVIDREEHGYVADLTNHIHLQKSHFRLWPKVLQIVGLGYSCFYPYSTQWTRRNRLQR